MNQHTENRGFTLVEIMIALAILAVAMTALVETQGGAVVATLDSQRYLTATWLAQEKLAEVTLRLDKEGFTTRDINEEGDFSDLSLTFGDDDMEDFSDYKRAYTIRQIDLALGDMSGAMDQLTEAGYGGSAEQQEQLEASQQGQDLSSLGIQPDMVGDMLSPYIREVRVIVWWGPDSEFESDEGCFSCVDITSHAVNPSGLTSIPQDATE
jgi:general secretion pathway protein I